MSEREFSEGEKRAMERAIEFKLGRKAEVLKDTESSDEDFLNALRDVCQLNLIRDDIKK